MSDYVTLKMGDQEAEWRVDLHLLDYLLTKIRNISYERGDFYIDDELITIDGDCFFYEAVDEIQKLLRIIRDHQKTGYPIQLRIVALDE